MSRPSVRSATKLVAVCLLCQVHQSIAADYTVGDFEGFVYVLGDDFGPSSTSASAGYINNGNPGTGAPDGANNANYYFNNAGHQTGWDDWSNGSVMSNSSVGVTSGTTAIKVAPLTGYSQNLAVKIQALPNGDGTAAFNAFMANTHVAVDVTYDPAEWVGAPQAFGSRILLAYNRGPNGQYINSIGAYDPADTNGFHNVNIDTGNPANPGLWDEVDYPALHTRTMYWDYSSYTADGTNYVDLRNFSTSDTNGSAGWLEFMLTEISNTAYSSVAYHFDNFRFTTPTLIGTNGDLDDDGDVDSHDIDTLWNVIRPEVVGSQDPNNNDTEDLNNDGFVNEKDVDYMLRFLLTAGTGRAYGDADLDGGVGGLDYTAWRVRAGTGWANGDFDGDGGVGGLDYTLWRTRPTAYPSTVGPHGNGPQVVPEPASLVLLGVGLPALALVAARRRRR